MSLRYKRGCETAAELNAKLDKAQRDQVEAEKLKQELEKDLTRARGDIHKLKKKNKSYSDKVSSQRAQIRDLTKEKRALEARCNFFSGEGASLLVKNLLASSQFIEFMADLCISVKDQGSTFAYDEVKRLHPDIEVDKLEGYDANSGGNLNTLMARLTSGQFDFPVEGLIPSFQIGSTSYAAGADGGETPGSKETSRTGATTQDGTSRACEDGEEPLSA